jgi:hypothetical protein
VGGPSQARPSFGEAFVSHVGAEGQGGPKTMSILPKRTRVAGIAAAAAALLVVAAASEARVVEIAINTTTSPVFNGQAFGDVGPYEELRGTVRGELDPADRRNAVITDIELASRNANGKVEYTATFTLLKPVDMRKASGVLVYEVNNRGNKILPGFLNVGMSPTNPAGDGFLYRTGNVYLWSGWQGDLVFNPTSPAETIDVPVARNPDGSSVTGPVFARFVTVPGNVNTQSLPGRGRTPASLHDAGEADLHRAREQRGRPHGRCANSERRLGVRGLPQHALPRRPGSDAHLPEEWLRSEPDL